MTKLPKHKERRAYTLESKQMALAEDQLEIAVMGASKLDKDTLLEVKLGWPDSDRPQVHKSATAKSSQTLPDYKSVRFMIDRDDGRKGFIHKLERRTLVQFGPQQRRHLLAADPQKIRCLLACGILTQRLCSAPLVAVFVCELCSEVSTLVAL